MLKVLKNNEIELTRGDTAELKVDITDDSDNPYTVGADDTLTLSVKRNVKESEYCVTKSVKGDNIINLEPKDTAGLACREYVYDVELVTSDGRTYTVIEKTPFVLRDEVTTR